MKKNKKSKTLETLEEPEPQSDSQFDFSRALTRVAVAQICQSVGYVSAKSSALQTLTTVAALYLKTLTTVAASTANRFGRTESNLLDIVAAMEDLGSVRGFVGASDVARPLLKSSILGGVIEFVDRVDEIPFAQAIRRMEGWRFGIRCGDGVKDNVGAAAAKKYVPIWLPRFPDPKTYREEEDDDEKRGRFREVLFPNGRVEEVSGSRKSEEDKAGKRGGEELRRDRFTVKFTIGAKRMRNRLEVDADMCRNGVREVAALSEEKERPWKEKEKKVYVRRGKGLLSKSAEKSVVEV